LPLSSRPRRGLASRLHGDAKIGQSPPSSGGLREIGPVARTETRRTSTRSGRDDSPGRVSIFPPYGLGRPVVLSYIRHELVRQIFHRNENAARDDSTLDLGKPQLDLTRALHWIRTSGARRAVCDSPGREPWVGVSPPSGARRAAFRRSGHVPRGKCRPPGSGRGGAHRHPGLTPWAITYRPPGSGTMPHVCR